MKSQVIYGKNIVLEALKSGRPLEKVYIQKGLRAEFFTRLVNSLRLKATPYTLVDRITLDRFSENGNHQGVLAIVGEKSYLYLEKLLGRAAKKPDPFLLVLLQVFDPHNLGSLLRSAEGAGVSGIIIPRRHCCGLTPTVAKVSAGGIEYLPVCRVINIATTLDLLKEEGYKIIGADSEAKTEYTRISYRGQIALLLGGEDKALSANIKKRCDEVVRINMAGKLSSLNLSVAGAVLMFEALRQRLKGKV